MNQQNQGRQRLLIHWGGGTQFRTIKGMAGNKTKVIDMRKGT